jgi:hypothetical protein
MIGWLKQSLILYILRACQNYKMKRLIMSTFPPTIAFEKKKKTDGF